MRQTLRIQQIKDRMLALLEKALLLRHPFEKEGWLLESCLRHASPACAEARAHVQG